MRASHVGGIFLPFIFGVIAALAVGGGCTHTQHRRATVNQAGTLSEIYQNQVLNNLAKFVRDPNALPDFSFPTEGISYVNDTGNLDFLVKWMWTTPLTGNNDLGGTGERTIRESWTLEPIADPRKLELMRCAYQQAVATCCGNMVSEDCPNCARRFAEFYTGDSTSMSLSDDEGRVTADCQNAPCWFHVGTKKDVPKNCPCHLVGNHCGTYVWVCPGIGTDQLTKLTLTILDFAINPPKASSPPATKKVIARYNSEGGVIEWREEYTVPKDEQFGTVDDKTAEILGSGKMLLPPSSKNAVPSPGRPNSVIIIESKGIQQTIQELNAAGGLD